MSQVVLSDKSGRPLLLATDDGQLLLAANGLPLVGQPKAFARLTGLTAAQDPVVSIVTDQDADGIYEIDHRIAITVATTHAITVNAVYTDPGGTVRTLVLDSNGPSAQYTTSIANAQGAIPYSGRPVRVRCKAGTTLKVTTSGTFTTVTYDAEAQINRIR